jgi:hypothetical protein
MILPFVMTWIRNALFRAQSYGFGESTIFPAIVTAQLKCVMTEQQFASARETNATLAKGLSEVKECFLA